MVLNRLQGWAEQLLKKTPLFEETKCAIIIIIIIIINLFLSKWFLQVSFYMCLGS